jgi:hypothetical protein
MKLLIKTLILLLSLGLLTAQEPSIEETSEESYWDVAKKMYEEFFSEDRDLKEETKQWV